MAGLVQYSDSSSESDEESNNRPPPIKRLPLPPPNISLFSDEIKPPSQQDHKGRIRTFAHEIGTWASYVSVPVPHQHDWLELCQSLCASLNTVCQSHQLFHTVENVHISLTRTHALRHHWLKEMNEAFTAVAQCHKRFHVGVRDIAVYVNDEKTRTFISIKVNSGSEQLEKLTREFDRELEQYNLQPFYTEPSYHASLCWCVHDARNLLTEKVLDRLQTTLDEFLKDDQDCGLFQVNGLLWKTGNKSSILNLLSH